MERNSGKEDRSLGELFAELTQETRTLMLQEFRLAKAELSEKISKVEHGIVSLAIGGLVAFAGFLGLLTTAIIALGLALNNWWLASLIVGGVVTLIGIVLISKGIENLKAKNLALTRTAETLEEDKQWVKAQMR